MKFFLSKILLVTRLIQVTQKYYWLCLINFNNHNIWCRTMAINMK